MATYKITDPNTGKTIRVTGDSPPSEQELNDIFSAASDSSSPAKRSLAGKAWDALAIPEQMSRQGLQQIAELTPGYEPQGKPGMASKTLKAILPISGALPQGQVQDVLMNIPKVGAESTAELAPGFVSRASLLTAGAGQGMKLAAKLPVVRSFGSGVASQMESLSGAKPGSIETAAQDSTLLGASGKKAVQGMYEEAKKLSGPIREELSEIPNKLEFVQKAFQLAKEKVLTPLEALEARKTLSAIKKSVTNEFFHKANNAFDSVAKTTFKGADAAYQRANMAESLRHVFPQNKYGGTSAFKLGLQSIADSDSMAGLLFRGALSPIAQGTAATVAGMTGRAVTNPRLAASLGAAINSRKKKSNAR